VYLLNCRSCAFGLRIEKYYYRLRPKTVSCLLCSCRILITTNRILFHWPQDSCRSQLLPAPHGVSSVKWNRNSHCVLSYYTHVKTPPPPKKRSCPRQKIFPCLLADYCAFSFLQQWPITPAVLPPVSVTGMMSSFGRLMQASHSPVLSDSLPFYTVFLPVTFSTASRPAPKPTQSPIQMVPESLSWGVMRPEREAEHSPQPRAEVKECVELYLHTPIRPHGVVLNLAQG
jgi:hypothetical protein